MMQGLSYPEAAVVLETTEGTIAWRIHESRKQMAPRARDDDGGFRRRRPPARAPLRGRPPRATRRVRLPRSRWRWRCSHPRSEQPPGLVRGSYALARARLAVRLRLNFRATGVADLVRLRDPGCSGMRRGAVPSRPERWRRLHERHAPRFYRLARRMRGGLIEGRGFSTRVDILPVEWTSTLRLQVLGLFRCRGRTFELTSAAHRTRCSSSRSTRSRRGRELRPGAPGGHARGRSR